MGKGHKPYGKETVLLYFVRVEVEIYLSLIDPMIYSAVASMKRMMTEAISALVAVP